MNIQKNVSVVVSIAILASSLILYFAAGNFSEQDSYVETKGLSEKIVKSDIAIWSINFQVKGNDIDSMYKQIEEGIEKVKVFLQKEGFEDTEVSVAPLNMYQNTYQGALFRYDVTVQMSVYTSKVDQVKDASEKTMSLIKDGILLTNNYIEFDFTNLNSIKPQMIAEATQNAQKSAIEFTDNSGSQIGKLVRARQGVFSITAKDPGSPEYKKVRIVSTLRYLLK